MRNLMGGRAGKKMLSMLGSPQLPSTACVVFIVLIALVAFDIISIQINTRISVPHSADVATQEVTEAQGPLICAEDTLPELFDFSLLGESSSAPGSAEDTEHRKVRRRDPASSFTAERPLGDALEAHQIHTIGGLESLRRRQNKQNANYTAVEQKYAFKMVPPNSMDHDDMQWCPGLRQVDLKPVDEKLKFLFILGAQKAGTTWLHQALMRHPIFEEAERGYMWGWNKEVRFFNSIPLGTSQEYLDLFAPKKLRRPLYGIPTVFLDSTPNYLFSPTVAPRVKQMVPHAKFVIVLRDPVARTVSSHNMMYTQSHRCWDRVCMQETAPLLQEFRKDRDLDFKWPEDLSGCNFNSLTEDPEQRRTWGDCWRCDHFVYACKMLSHTEALALGGCKHNLIPHVATMPLTQYGLYAAQIAWWMSFFPPDSFLILTREELMDPDRVFNALNKILEHVGYPEARQFTEKLVGKVAGFKGKYKGDMSEDDQQALKEIADFFEQPNKDLQALMDTFFPEAGFKGFTPEFER